MSRDGHYIYGFKTPQEATLNTPETLAVSYNSTDYTSYITDETVKTLTIVDSSGENHYFPCCKTTNHSDGVSKLSIYDGSDTWYVLNGIKYTVTESYQTSSAYEATKTGTTSFEGTFNHYYYTFAETYTTVYVNNVKIIGLGSSSSSSTTPSTWSTPSSSNPTQSNPISYNGAKIWINGNKIYAYGQALTGTTHVVWVKYSGTYTVAPKYSTKTVTKEY